jgi:outer membrane protein assembly factor BamE (lipoprotein component of BamABCDE complex)
MKVPSMKLPALMTMTIAAALLAGCAQMRQHKGVVLDQRLAAGIQPGVDNKDSVEKLLGRPTFTGQFTPNDWYTCRATSIRSLSVTRR